METLSLLRRAVKGSFWILMLRVLQQLLFLCRLVVIARFLTPHDLGIVGIALLVMSALDTFSQFGFDAALVQKKGDVEAFLDTAWTMLAARGMVLYVLLWSAAPFAAAAFHVKESVWLIRLAGLSLVIRSFTHVGIVYFQKTLSFSKQFTYQIVGTGAEFLGTVACILCLRNAWAIVAGLLLGDAVRLIASYRMCPRPLRFSWNWDRAKELIYFGRWVLGSGALVFLTLQMDSICVGKYLGASLLGYYQLANRISNTPATEITHVISQIAFPLYARLQDNAEQLRSVYIRVMQIVAFLSFLLAGSIIALSPYFVRIFFGEKWLPAIPVIQILAVAGLLRSIAAIPGRLFYAVGKPHLDTHIQIVRFVVMAACLYPLTVRWGIVGSAYAVLASILVSTVIFCAVTMKIVRRSGAPLFRAVVLMTIATTVMVFFYTQVPLSAHAFGGFFMAALSGIAVYAAVAYVLDKSLKVHLYPALKQCLIALRV